MSATFSGAVPVPKPQYAGLSVLVTGASRGIGFELVRQYARAHSDNVVFAAVRDPSTSTALKEFAAQNTNVHIITLDVSNASSIRKSVDQVKSKTKKLDVLINNAGIYGDQSAKDPLVTTAAQFNEVFNTNVTGVLIVTQSYVPLLSLSSSAKVVNVSSCMGSNQFANIFGKPTAAYGVSKAALNYLTTAFRYAVPNVTFLAIHPGWVATDMGNAGGDAAPTKTKDSAQAIRYYTAEKGVESSGDFLDCMNGEILAY